MTTGSKTIKIQPADKINNMPKAALYITAKFMWTFLFYDTDVNENRAHVHVGKKDTKKLAKFWLEPNVEMADDGSLTQAQIKQIAEILQKHRSKFLKQWQIFKSGKKITMLKIKE